MSIHVLPQTAVRALGSGQALTDPASVVKELIDNALDARATNITIEISTNTIDVIQVKDNGHGISPPDRPLVAKPYCTSKLKDEKDLALVGSSYLGFRGEALNSALEMSGDMTITTRVEGESVATALKISSTGETVEERASHPPGTTVRIANFLKNQPVRKQVALKNANKALANIKHLLHAYAFARSDTRLSLRVIKAKNDRDNWTYAPKPNSGIEDTALKVVGKPCASQCAWVELDFEGFILQAFLPRPDAHATKISNLGQYVSVNRRPLTTTRGISKQLIRIYKEGVKNSPFLEDAKDSFLYLSVSCPPESYDANIEPAKDDVLFADVDKISEAMRRLMAISYPEKETSIEEDPDSLKHLRPAEARTARTHDEVFNTPEPRSKRQRTEVKGNMYDVDEDDLTLLMNAVDESVQSVVEEPEEDQPQSSKSAAVSNPWIMAKMNSYGNKRNNVNIQLMTPAKEVSNNANFVRPQSLEPQSMSHSPLGLTTPQPSSPMNRPSPSEDPNLFANRRTIGATDLPPPVPHLMGLSISPMGQSLEPLRDSPAPRRLSLLQPETEGTTLDMIPEAAPKRRSAPKQAQRGYVNKPFVPPIDPERDAWFHFPESHKRNPPSAWKGRSQRQTGEGFVPQGEPFETSQPQRLTPPANNADIRDFLGRGRTHTRAPSPSIVETEPALDENMAPESGPINGFVPASELNLNSTQFADSSRPTLRPPRRRRTGSDRVLEDITGNGIIDDGDESYTEDRPKRRRTIDANKPRRTKSSTLPLEKVPPSACMQNIVTSLSITTNNIERYIQNVEPEGTFTAWNEPASDTTFPSVHAFVEEDVQMWTTSLQRLLQAYDPEGEVVRDLEDVVRSAVGRWGTFAGV